MDSLGYEFENEALLEEALTHPSCNLKQADGTAFSYQRLEFLGDSILGAVISQLLIKHFPHEPEGDLARRKSALVQKQAIAKVVQRLALNKHIRFSDTEGNSGGADNVSVQEDVGEAVIGAIFADGGFEAAQAFISANWLEAMLAQKTAPIDAKTALQEWTQARSLGLPKYTIVEQTGTAHEPTFRVEVVVEGQPSQRAHAATKRKAERYAAIKMLEAINHG